MRWMVLVVVGLMVACSGATESSSSGGKGGSSNASATACGASTFGAPRTECDACVTDKCCAEAEACAADEVCTKCLKNDPEIQTGAIDCAGSQKLIAVGDCADNAKISCSSCRSSGGGGGGGETVNCLERSCSDGCPANPCANSANACAQCGRCQCS